MAADQPLTRAWQACVARRYASAVSARAREGRTVSIRALAAAADLGKTTLTNVAAGRGTLSLRSGARVSAALDVHPAWLLCFDLVRRQFRDDFDVLHARRAAISRTHFAVADYALDSDWAERARERRPMFGAAAKISPRDRERGWTSDFTRRLNAAIDRAGRTRALSNAQLAAAIGVLKTRRVVLIRSGRAAPTLVQALALARVLRVDPATLLGFDDLRADHGNDWRWLRAASSEVSTGYYDIAYYAITLDGAPETAARSTQTFAVPSTERFELAYLRAFGAHLVDLMNRTRGGVTGRSIERSTGIASTDVHQWSVAHKAPGALNGLVLARFFGARPADFLGFVSIRAHFKTVENLLAQRPRLTRNFFDIAFYALTEGNCEQTILARPSARASN